MRKIISIICVSTLLPITSFANSINEYSWELVYSKKPNSWIENINNMVCNYKKIENIWDGEIYDFFLEKDTNSLILKKYSQEQNWLNEYVYDKIKINWDIDKLYNYKETGKYNTVIAWSWVYYTPKKWINEDNYNSKWWSSDEYKKINELDNLNEKIILNDKWFEYFLSKQDDVIKIWDIKSKEFDGWSYFKSISFKINNEIFNLWSNKVNDILPISFDYIPWGALSFNIPVKMTWVDVLYKDWKYIYRWNKWIFNSNGTFNFIKVNSFQWSFDEPILYYWCRDKVSINYYNNFIKQLDLRFNKIDKKDWSDEIYEKVFDKINSMKIENNNTKKSFLFRVIRDKIYTKYNPDYWNMISDL